MQIKDAFKCVMGDTSTLKRSKSSLKLTKYLIHFFIVLIFFTSIPNAHGITVEECSYMGETTLKDIHGKRFQLKEFRGKIIIITFWSTWCMRCKEELTFLHEKFEKNGNVVIITVNQDSDKKINEQRVKEFIDEIGGHELIVVLDRNFEFWDRFGLNALPATIILDREGKVAFSEANFYIDSPEIIEGEYEKIHTENYCGSVNQ